MKLRKGIAPLIFLLAAAVLILVLASVSILAGREQQGETISQETKCKIKKENCIPQVGSVNTEPGDKYVQNDPKDNRRKLGKITVRGKNFHKDTNEVFLDGNSLGTFPAASSLQTHIKVTGANNTPLNLDLSDGNHRIFVRSPYGDSNEVDFNWKQGSSP